MIGTFQVRVVSEEQVTTRSLGRRYLERVGQGEVLPDAELCRSCQYVRID